MYRVSEGLISRKPSEGNENRITKIQSQKDKFGLAETRTQTSLVIETNWRTLIASITLSPTGELPELFVCF